MRAILRFDACEGRLRAGPFAIERDTLNGVGVCLLPDMVTHSKKVSDQRLGDGIAICNRECGSGLVVPTIPRRIRKRRKKVDECGEFRRSHLACNACVTQICWTKDLRDQ